ncbi:hypothetical protein [Ferrovibrio terrae]|uniref:hypothetical protein n=1 Tax=Ferrovibrio terrae TaxID=2594003 RepID=UPI003137B4B4
MARFQIPYLVAKPNANGTARHYWQPDKLKIRAIATAGFSVAQVLAEAGLAERRLQDDFNDAARQAEQLNAIANGFIAGTVKPSLSAAMAQQPDAQQLAPLIRRPDLVASVIANYKSSRHFTKLAASTKRDYTNHLAKIEAVYGDMSAKKIGSLMIEEYYEALLDTGHIHYANARMRIFSIVFTHAERIEIRGKHTNPCNNMGLTGTTPRVRFWSEQETASIIAAADRAGLPSIGDAVITALYTTQRQGDVLTVPRMAYTTSHLRFTQSKTKAVVRIPVANLQQISDRLPAALARAQILAPDAPQLIICETTKAGWSKDHFRHVFSEIRAQAAKSCPSLLGDEGAGLPSALFMDLRDTAITRLALAECTLDEICSWSGHSRAGVTDVLKHYIDLSAGFADKAGEKLATYLQREAPEAIGGKA